MFSPYDLSDCKVLDLSQNFSMNSPSFAFYEGPTVKWVKLLAFEGVNAQLLTTTNHIATHLDSPSHFHDPGSNIAGIPIETLVGPSCIVDLTRYDVGDYEPVLDQALELIDYERFRTEIQPEAREAGRPWGSAWWPTWKAPASAPTRGPGCRCRPAAR